MQSLRSFSFVLVVLLFGAATAKAQNEPKVDLAITFTDGRSLKANTNQNFWMDGGSIELGANVWKGWGLGANFSGTHANSIGTSGIPLSMVIETFGPRYRWTGKKNHFSLYGEALVGEANALDTVVPAKNGVQAYGNGLALQVGGGFDYLVGRHFSVRMLQASWLRTQIPNTTDNVENTLMLGTGVAVRFGH